MNKLRITATISVCLFAAVTLVGTLAPFYVEAQENKSVVTREVPTETPDPYLDDASKETATAEKVEFITETRTETLPHGVVENGIDTIPRGDRRVISEGVDGLVKRTYLVKYVNGQKADEAIYTETVVTPAVDEVAEVGVGGTVTANDGTVYTYNYRRQMEATAYTYLPPYTGMITATGATLKKGIVAVDPREIPMHTKMFITSDSWEYGLGVAEDTGGKIKGNIIDLAYMEYDTCIQFGRRQMQVYFID